jgi:hypothetical protein
MPINEAMCSYNRSYRSWLQQRKGSFDMNVDMAFSRDFLGKKR